MKNKIVIALLTVVVFASCSTPKYSYYFDRHDYNSGKKQPQLTSIEPVLSIDPQTLVASTEEQPVIFPEEASPATGQGKTYLQMSKSERKEIRRELKKEIKTYVAAKKKYASVESVKATQGMDHDLKLAAIFGAVGIAGLIIGTDVFFIIGGIALLIGVIFFVKWMIRQ